MKGKIDAIEAVNLWASSPINRPHACDGKVTTAEMAEKLVFLAHYGKVTLREKFPAAGNRRMPDHPGAIPHLTLGYSVFSPVFIAEKLKEAKAKDAGRRAPPREGADARRRPASRRLLKLDKAKLWKGSVFPKTEADERPRLRLGRLLADPEGRCPTTRRRRSRRSATSSPALNARAAYFAAKEGDVAIREAKREYGRRSPYQIPRIKGTFALHQLRLLLGNETFLKAMDAAFTANAGRDVTTAQLVAALSKAAGRDVAPFLAPVDRGEGLPRPEGRGDGREGRRRLDGDARRHAGRARRTTSSGASRSTPAASASSSRTR